MKNLIGYTKFIVFLSLSIICAILFIITLSDWYTAIDFFEFIKYGTFAVIEYFLVKYLASESYKIYKSSTNNDNNIWN